MQREGKKQGNHIDDDDNDGSGGGGGVSAVIRQ
jgi:hypothetical protein